MLMASGYLPPEVIEHQGKRIYPDHTAQLKRGSDISDVVSKCEIEEGRVIGVNKVGYPRYTLSFEDWVDYGVTVSLDSGRDVQVILGPHMSLLVTDLGLQNPSELNGKTVSCYKMPPEFRRGDTEQLGLSVD